MAVDANVAPIHLIEALDRYSATFSALLERHVDLAGVPQPLADAAMYSLRAPGKRLRPFLVHQCAGLSGRPGPAVDRVAVALECVHVFTLIHDDLPCMDDASQRRGQPANHRVFGEAHAVLAGDALLALAMELAATAEVPPAVAVTIVRELAAAIGWAGVIGGQVLDLEGESHPPSAERVAAIHRAKTARLIEASCRCGALAVEAKATDVRAVAQYGQALGLAFQIADDLLDCQSAPEVLGKDTGADVARSKQTYPAVFGTARSREQAEGFSRAAVAALEAYGEDARILQQLADFVVQRST